MVNKAAHFSLEHGIITSSFLNLDSEEKDYFLLLIQHERAGNKELENFFFSKIEQVHKNRREISERIKAKSNLSSEDQTVYYSAWYFSAVHLCLFIPKLENSSSIAKYLGLQKKTVDETLKFLIGAGLVRETTAGDLQPLPIRAHLHSQSHLLQKHHTHWRIRAIQSIEDADEKDLHYSAVFSLSKNAAETIRNTLLESIQKVEPVIKESEDEVLYVMGIDWFGLKKQSEVG